MTHLGKTILETILWERLPVEEVRRRVVVCGDEHLRAALRDGRGVMLFASHLGNFTSLAVAVHALGVEVRSAGNPMPFRQFEQMIQNLSRRFGVERMFTGQGIPSAAARTFRRGGIFTLFVDFSLPDPRNVWLRFGRAEMNVNLGPALIAVRHRVPVVVMTSARLEDTQHRVTIHPPLPIGGGGSVQLSAAHLMQQALDIVAIELAQRPEQWWPWDFAPVRTPRT